MPVTTLLPTLYRHILIRTAPAQAGLSQWVQECDAALSLTTPWRAGSRHKVASKKSNRRSNSCPSSNQRGCCRNQACSKPRRQSVSAQKKKGFTIQAISCLFGAQQYLPWQLGPATQKLLRICKILTLTDLLLYRFNFKKSLPHSKRRQRIKRSFQIRIIGVNGAQACKLIGAFGVEP